MSRINNVIERIEGMIESNSEEAKVDVIRQTYSKALIGALIVLKEEASKAMPHDEVPSTEDWVTTVEELEDSILKLKQEASKESPCLSCKHLNNNQCNVEPGVSICVHDNLLSDYFEPKEQTNDRT